VITGQITSHGKTHKSEWITSTSPRGYFKRPSAEPP
jgi:hypothetical protein